jgi:hypothetical protein
VHFSRRPLLAAVAAIAICLIAPFPASAADKLDDHGFVPKLGPWRASSIQTAPQPTGPVIRKAQFSVSRRPLDRGKYRYHYYLKTFAVEFPEVCPTAPGPEALPVEAIIAYHYNMRLRPKETKRGRVWTYDRSFATDQHLQGNPLGTTRLMREKLSLTAKGASLRVTIPKLSNCQPAFLTARLKPSK